MIDKISQQTCYKPFMRVQKNFGHKNIQNDDSISYNTVRSVSILGSAAGALGAAYVISKHQTQKLNKTVNIFNIKYGEPELLGVAMSSVISGFTAGSLVDNKKHIGAKFKEAVHQTVANIICPLAIVGIALKIYEKYADKIKLPQFKPVNSLKRGLNIAIKVAPAMTITLGSLAAGVFAGTKIANSINKTDSTDKERKVKPLDFCYHPDDIATALVLADKTGSIQKTVGKIIPFVFMLHGYEAGSKR